MVEIIVAVIVVLAALLCAGVSGYLLASQDLTLRIVVSEEVPSTEDAEVPSEPGESRAAPPEDILKFCAQESEEWARQELLRKAQSLYDEYGDWNAVLMQLQLEARIVE